MYTDDRAGGESLSEQGEGDEDADQDDVHSAEGDDAAATARGGRRGRLWLDDDSTLLQNTGNDSDSDSDAGRWSHDKFNPDATSDDDAEPHNRDDFNAVRCCCLWLCCCTNSH